MLSRSVGKHARSRAKRFAFCMVIGLSGYAAVSEDGGFNCRSVYSLIQFYAGGFDDLAPFLEFRFDERVKLWPR